MRAEGKMAVANILFNKSNNLFSKIFSDNFSIIKHGMSQYPSYYIRPIYQKDTQEEAFKAGEAQKLAHIPTRAALNNQTSSVFHDPLISLFTNYVMRDGLKQLARGLVEQTFEKVKRVQLEKYHKAETEEEMTQIELNPRKVFHRAVENCQPLLELSPVKRGGVTYQVPVPITSKRSQFKSMKWLIEAGRTKDQEMHFPDKLAYELIDAANNTGNVVKRKQDLHKQCEANKAYSHYRWG